MNFTYLEGVVKVIEALERCDKARRFGYSVLAVIAIYASAALVTAFRWW